jgi:hypothetical protein
MRYINLIIFILLSVFFSIHVLILEILITGLKSEELLTTDEKIINFK